jgi:hypothetical protein
MSSGDKGVGARASAVDRLKAWLVTGSPGRGLSFAIDFAVAVRRGLLRRP